MILRGVQDFGTLGWLRFFSNVGARTLRNTVGDGATRACARARLKVAKHAAA
jgi:hypothetical protein